MDRRRIRRAAAFLAVSAFVAACTGGGPSLGPTGVREVREVPYAKALLPSAQDLALDIYAPPGAGPFPLVVYMPGGSQQRDSGITIARRLAERGAVVLVADHHHGTGMDDPPLGIASRDTLEQAACALRMAREVGAEYGGDTGGLTWAGYSYGGYIGFEVALADPDAERLWDEFVAVHGGPSRQYECMAAGGPVPVTALVVTGAVRFADLWPDAYAADPAVRDFVATTVRIGNNPDLVVRMIHGTADEEAPYALAERLAAQLTEAGYDAKLTTLKGGNHTSNTEVMAAMVLEVLGR